MRGDLLRGEIPRGAAIGSLGVIEVARVIAAHHIFIMQTRTIPIINHQSSMTQRRSPDM